MKSAADEKERNVVEREAADISFLFFDNLQTVWFIFGSNVLTFLEAKWNGTIIVW